MYLSEMSPLLDGLPVGLSERISVLLSKWLDFDNQEHVDSCSRNVHINDIFTDFMNTL